MKRTPQQVFPAVTSAGWWSRVATERGVILFGAINTARVANAFYPFFPFASALSKFFLTLNFTILVIKAQGIGLSNGNLTVPFPP